jgi:DNA-binding response OmpR family regulator
VDVAARHCLLGDREISLRPKEFDLLARLASEPNVAVSREALMSDVWDEHWFGSTKTLDVHVAGLRSKLARTAEEATGQQLCLPAIVTLRGFGYRLEISGADR